MLDEGQTLTPITEQNIQARIRAQRMWNWSNSASGLFLQTGNMTEKAVGYTTVGGDLMGALAVLANVPKTVVMYLLDYLLETRGYPGIAAVLEKPAGPELAPNQSGEEELMPFTVLDACFYLFAGEKMTPDEVELVVAEMFPDIARDTVDGYVRSSSDCSCSRSTNGCNHPSHCTSATSTWNENGPCNCQSSQARNGPGSRRPCAGDVARH